MQTERMPDLSRQEVEKFVVRLPKGMRKKISEVSRLSHRSMNSEIIARLEQSFAQQDDTETPAPTAPVLRAVGRSSGADRESALLAYFRTLSADKQTALLALLAS